MRCRGPREADNGEAWHGGDGKQAARREGEREGANRPVRFLTPRWSSGGGSRQQKSGEVVTATMIEVQQRMQRRLGLRGKEAAAAGCAEPRARGGGFIGWPRGLGAQARGSAQRGPVPCRGRT
jgi:hypothetical protein